MLNLPLEVLLSMGGEGGGGDNPNYLLTSLQEHQESQEVQEY